MSLRIGQAYYNATSISFTVSGTYHTECWIVVPWTPTATVLPEPEVHFAFSSSCGTHFHVLSNL